MKHNSTPPGFSKPCIMKQPTYVLYTVGMIHDNGTTSVIQFNNSDPKSPAKTILRAYNRGEAGKSFRFPMARPLVAAYVNPTNQLYDLRNNQGLFELRVAAGHTDLTS